MMSLASSSTVHKENFHPEVKSRPLLILFCVLHLLHSQILKISIKTSQWFEILALFHIKKHWNKENPTSLMPEKTITLASCFNICYKAITDSNGVIWLNVFQKTVLYGTFSIRERQEKTVDSLDFKDHDIGWCNKILCRMCNCVGPSQMGVGVWILYLKMNCILRGMCIIALCEYFHRYTVCATVFLSTLSICDSTVISSIQLIIKFILYEFYMHIFNLLQVKEWSNEVSHWYITWQEETYPGTTHQEEGSEGLITHNRLEHKKVCMHNVCFIVTHCYMISQCVPEGYITCHLAVPLLIKNTSLYFFPWRLFSNCICFVYR